MENKEIKINLNIKNKKFYTQQTFNLISQFAFIGVGVVVDSSAMQWIGFILFCFIIGLIVARARTVEDKERYLDLSIKEAEETIQNLKREIFDIKEEEKL